MPGVGLGLRSEVVEVVVKRKQHQQHQSRRRRKEERHGNKVVEGERSPGSVVSFSNCKSGNNTNCSTSSNHRFFVSDSGGSVLSTSASASVDGRSFGSDHDSLFPRTCLHLSGRWRCSGHNADPEKRRASLNTNTQHISKDIDHGGGSREEEEERQEITLLDSAKYSLSLALRECQNRRFRSQGLPSPVVEWKQRKRRPASFDFNSHMSDTSVSSPRSFVAGSVLKKSPDMPVRSRSGMFPSPGTPNYGHGVAAAGYQKGWSSERMPLQANAGRRGGSSAAMFPFGNGKTLPSKWEDAEKWISSPVSGNGVRQLVLQPHHRRPKSKSGPLGTPAGGIGGCYSSSASPSLLGLDGGSVQNFTANSPFMAGALVADREGSGGGTDREGGDGASGGGRSHSAESGNGMMRSASVHGWSDLLMESSSSLPSSQDEKLEGTKDGDITVSSVILRKDMGTQMSPQCSSHSSSKGWHHPSSPRRSTHTIGELHSYFSKLEVRDVQVDDRVTVTRWSKKHIACDADKSSLNIIQWKRKKAEAKNSSWEVAETKCTSRSKREDAKITAWENLQKAKAEAAIRKLEMKLEKKKSSSMDKILNKLRRAQRKSQEMWDAVSASQTHQVAVTTRTAPAFRRTSYIGSLSGCFTCHAL